MKQAPFSAFSIRQITDMEGGIIRPDMDMDTAGGTTDDTGIIIEGITIGGITIGGIITEGITTMGTDISGADQL